MTTLPRRAAALLAAALLLAGCGLGPGEERSGSAELRVTRDFGHERLASARLEPLREADTAMRFLQSERDVETRYGGGFVQSIDGLEGEGSGGRRDWFYFVNGLQGEVGAADYELSPGDVLQWDYRDWEAAMSVPAIVGAYPEPFLSGTGGKRIPTRVECEDESGAACKAVKLRLSEAGINATGAPLGAPAGADILRVIVAKWPVARSVKALATLEDGPAESGVFARFSPDGRALTLLDEAGEEAESAGPGTGLVAATAPEGQQVVWAVTGVDDAGVEAAARTLEPEALADAFAVAATPDGPVPLPIAEGGVP